MELRIVGEGVRYDTEGKGGRGWTMEVTSNVGQSENVPAAGTGSGDNPETFETFSNSNLKHTSDIHNQDASDTTEEAKKAIPTG